MDNYSKELDVKNYRKMKENLDNSQKGKEYLDNSKKEKGDPGYDILAEKFYERPSAEELLREREKLYEKCAKQYVIFTVAGSIILTSLLLVLLGIV